MKDKFSCPICGKLLFSSNGGRTRTDGITLACCYDKCSSNEQPIAWGRNEKAAYNILVYKYGPKDKRDKLTVEEDNTDNSESPQDSNMGVISNE